MTSSLILKSVLNMMKLVLTLNVGDLEHHKAVEQARYIYPDWFL